MCLPDLMKLPVCKLRVIMVLIGFSALVGGCAPREPITSMGASAPSTAEGSHMIATTRDQSGVIWKLMEESSPHATLYSLLRQPPGHRARRVAGPDSSFYWMLENYIPDQSTALEIAKQETQMIVTETGRNVMQEMILQKGAMFKIQRDAYLALRFKLPKDYFILRNQLE